MKIRKCKKCKRQWGVSKQSENNKNYICPHCAGKEKRKVKKLLQEPVTQAIASRKKLSFN